MTAKKVVTKKPVAKAAVKKPVTKAEAKPPVEKKVAPKVEAPAAIKESMVLYTIRLAPSIVAKLNEVGKKKGISHAELARDVLGAYFK